MCYCLYPVIFVAAIFITTVVYRLFFSNPKKIEENEDFEEGIKEFASLESFTPPPIVVEPLPETIVVPDTLSPSITEKPKAVRRPKRVLPKDQVDVPKEITKKPTKAKKPKNS